MNYFRFNRMVMIGLILTMASVNAAPVQLQNFSQFLASLEKGNDVKALLFFDQCKFIPAEGTELSVSDQRGSCARMNFDTFVHSNVKADGLLREAVTTSVEGYTEHENGEFLDNYKRLQVFSDGSALYYIAFADPITHKKTLSASWNCQINNGKNQGGLVLLGPEN